MRKLPDKRRLTNFLLQSLKPRASPYLVWDTNQRGLAVQVRPKGHRAWYCIYSFNGRPRWFHIADVSAIGLAKARELAAETGETLTEAVETGRLHQGDRVVCIAFGSGVVWGGIALRWIAPTR